MTTSGEPRSVAELMTRDPIVVGVDTRLADAAELMDFYRVSGLPVVDEDGRLVGVISQTDLLHARTTQALWQAWPGLAVRHLMTEPAVSVFRIPRSPRQPPSWSACTSIASSSLIPSKRHRSASCR